MLREGTSANATRVPKATKIPSTPNIPTDSNTPTIHATMCETEVPDDGILDVDVHLSVYPAVQLVAPHKQMLSLKKALRATASI